MDQDIRDAITQLEKLFTSTMANMEKQIENKIESVKEMLTTLMGHNDSEHTALKKQSEEHYITTRTNTENILKVDFKVDAAHRRIDDMEKDNEAGRGSRRFSIEMLLVFIGVIASILIGIFK